MDAAGKHAEEMKTLGFDDRSRLSDEQWFELYGPSGAGVGDPETAAEFALLISALEVRAGKRLRQPGRGKCLRAFVASPDGFRRCLEEASTRGNRNALGLLIRMVEADEHLPIEGED